MRIAALLPTLAAIACFFGKGPPNFKPELQAEVASDFVGTEYIQALYAGSALDTGRHSAVAERLAALPVAIVSCCVSLREGADEPRCL